MNANEYQQAAQLTATWDKDDLEYARHYIAIKTVGELGEVCDLLGKELRAGKPYRDKLVDEIGDVYWYLSAYAALKHVPFQQIIFDALSEHIPFQNPYDFVVAIADLMATFALVASVDTAEALGVASEIIGHLDGLCEARDIQRGDIYAANIEKITRRHATGTVKEHPDE